MFQVLESKKQKQKKGLMEVSIKTQIIVHGVFFAGLGRFILKW
jgi:hypothetical protein